MGGGGYFSDGEGASFLSGGCAPWGALVLMWGGGGVPKENLRMGGGGRSLHAPHYGKTY